MPSRSCASAAFIQLPAAMPTRRTVGLTRSRGLCRLFAILRCGAPVARMDGRDIPSHSGSRSSSFFMSRAIASASGSNSTFIPPLPKCCRSGLAARRARHRRYFLATNMDEERSKMSDEWEQNYPKARTKKEMTHSTEVYHLIGEIGGLPGPSVKVALNRAVVHLLPYLKTHYGRIRDLYYGEARLIRAEEIDALRACATDRRRKIEAGRAQVRDIAGLYRAAAERLRHLDEDYHRFEILRLEQQADQICPVDRAGAAPVGLGPSPSGEAAE